MFFANRLPAESVTVMRTPRFVNIASPNPLCSGSFSSFKTYELYIMLPCQERVMLEKMKNHTRNVTANERKWFCLEHVWVMKCSHFTSRCHFYKKKKKEKRKSQIPQWYSYILLSKRISGASQGARKQSGLKVISAHRHFLGTIAETTSAKIPGSQGNAEINPWSMASGHMLLLACRGKQ